MEKKAEGGRLSLYYSAETAHPLCQLHHLLHNGNALDALIQLVAATCR